MPNIKPYYIRAIHQWTVDSDLTALLLINALHERAVVPMDFVENGTIVLNLRPSAVHNLVIENEHIEFDARFKGVSMHVYVPVDAVLGIFARENSEGMFFDPKTDDGNDPKQSNKEKTKPNLQVVK